MTDIRTNSKYLLIATLIYIYVPVAIFMFGFTKTWIAIITCVIIAVFLRKLYSDHSKKLCEGMQINVSLKCLIWAILLLAIVCVLAGFGGITVQAGDWWKHNAVIHDLVEKDWPVYYTREEYSLLTYYLGQYMLPALVGKIFGHSFRVASICMGIWGFAGVVLVYLNLVRITRSDTTFKQLRTLVIMVFFCGCLVGAQTVLDALYPDSFYSLGSYHWVLVKWIQIQYRSNFVMLRWVYPQVIVPWLIVMLFAEDHRNMRNYVLLISPLLLYGTFSVVFLSFAALVCAVYELAVSENKKTTLRDIFSLSNILVFASFGLVMLAYFIGYMQVSKPASSSFGLGSYELSTIPVYIIFCLFMYGFHAILVYRENKKNILFYITVAALSVIPAFHMGLCNDWVMGTSIPALFMMMIFVINTLNEKKSSSGYGFRVGLLTALLIMGAWYPVREMADTAMSTEWGEDNTQDWYKTLETYSDRYCETVTEDILYNYYTYDLKGKFFYEHIARKKLDAVSYEETVTDTPF